METLVIIGLAIAVVVLLVLYIRERKACNSYINAETNFKRDILNAKNQVSHFQHHSSMHEEAFQNAELKIKSLGFSGVDDNQLADPVTIEKVSKIRASLEASSKKRFAEEQKKGVKQNLLNKPFGKPGLSNLLMKNENVWLLSKVKRRQPGMPGDTAIMAPLRPAQMV